MVTLTEEDLSLALEDIFTRASKEVRHFTDAKLLDKIAMEENGILMCKTRILEGQEMQVFGELANVESLKDLASLNFKVPLVDHHSSLTISLAYHFHIKFNHFGPNSTFLLSLGYAHVRGGKTILRRISDECVVCIKARKKYMEQVMAPIHGSQLSVTPIFYFTVMDSWGPITMYCPGHEKTTRRSKTYQAHMLVFVCSATGTVNCQIIEGYDAGNVLQGMNRFFAEACVPAIIYPDAAGSFLKALRRGEVELSDLEGKLSREQGIKFRTCPPQGHSAHSKVERKIGLIQQSLTKSGLMSE